MVWTADAGRTVSAVQIYSVKLNMTDAGTPLSHKLSSESSTLNILSLTLFSLKIYGVPSHIPSSNPTQDQKPN